MRLGRKEMINTFGMAPTTYIQTFILSLYNNSPIHSSIINSKAAYIVGNGLQTLDGVPIDVRVSPGSKIDEFINKIVKDYLIFNCFAVEVVYNVFNKPIEYHFVPVHKIRLNNSKAKFWVSESWRLHQRPVIYDRYKPGSQDSISKIFFFDGYNPSESKVYANPEYTNAIKAIQTDIDIREFNLNNIQNHFSPSTIITFFRGSNVSEEIKRQTLRLITETYTGATGKKVVVDFQDPTSLPANVQNISSNDWDKAYTQISLNCQQDIFIGHQVTSPMLFGVKTAGQLGASVELETAYEIFKDNYVINKRNEIAEGLNILFQEFELIPTQVEFADKQLFSSRISEVLKDKIYTINELRKEAGLPPYANGDRLLEEVPRITERGQNPPSDAGIGTPPVPLPSGAPVALPIGVQQSRHIHFEDELIQLTDEDFEKIKDLGTIQEEFEFIEEGDFINSREDFKRVELEFDMQSDIANYLISNDVSGKTVNQIKTALLKELGITITKADLRDVFETLKSAGVIHATISGTTNWTVDNIVATKPSTQPQRAVETMYSYVVRPGFGAPIIPTTRPFCRRMVKNNRLYTREELQQIGDVFGRDVFQLGGGWYKNPDTGELTPYCRHKFQQRIVVRRPTATQ